MKLLKILQAFCKEVERNNPHNLVLKGGTALSLYYLNHHRESEDLDFDAEKEQRKDHTKIKEYFKSIFDRLQKQMMITNYKIIKSDFATTNRYHIKVDIQTYKTFHTKIDIDFVELPANLIKKGELNLYLIERIFITKAVTFVNRKEFKDFYDLAHLAAKIDLASFSKRRKVAALLQEVIETAEAEDMKKMFKTAFRNVDLRFKKVKESQLDEFIQKTVRKLHIAMNEMNR